MQHHLILTNGRSGSNYLRSLLNQHPQVVNYGEVLGDWTIPYKLRKQLGLGGDSPESYLDYIYSSQVFFYLAQIYSAYSKITKKEKINFKNINQVATLGIKDFSINFVRKNLEHYLKEREDILVINLFRRNSLKRLISLQSMQLSGVVEVRGNGAKVKRKVYLPIDNLLPQLEIFEAEKNQQFDLLKEIEQKRILNIAYEDYFSSAKSQEQYNHEIFEFLGVPEMKVKSNHSRILPDKVSEKLENYEAVVQTLNGTEYEVYLLN
ncbi:MAG: hypothetical protein QNJ36_19425 [Calothrix sp. MO_167.B42]|nr:hypothetical protein [Calothrix sp. MO_167.B42]